MKQIVLFLLLGLVIGSTHAREAELQSKYPVDQTMDRYVKSLREAGVQVFQQQKMVNKITGKPEAKIVFANPLYGSSIAECHKGLRKDQPLQTIIRQNGNNEVVVYYELPDTPVNSFGVIECGNEADNIQNTLNRFASSAAR